MKRIISILLVICMLFICSISAFALTDEEQKVDSLIDKTQPAYMQMLEAAARLRYTIYDATNPVKTNVYQKDGFYYVDVAYTPSYYFTYFNNNSYYTLDPNTDYIKLFADIRIDGESWTKEMDIYESNIQCINNTHTIPFNTNKEFVFNLLSPQKIEGELNNPYKHLFEEKNGFYHLDLSKHTLELRLFVDCVLGPDGNEYHLPQSPVSVITAVTEDNVPTQLPIPDVQRATASQKYNTMSFRVTPHSVIDGLKKLSHDMHLKVEYTLHNNTYNVEFPCSDEYFYVINLGNIEWITNNEITKDNNNDIEIKCAFYDKTTDTTSDWYVGDVVVQDLPDRATIENWEPGKDDAPSKVPSNNVSTSINEKKTQKSDKSCNLCGICPVQPLGICLWLFIGIAVCFVAAIIVILVIKKSKSKENKK